MKILIICQTLDYYSGSPLYNYTLAMELRAQGHEVFVYSRWSENKIKENFLAAGIITLYDRPEGHFDLVLISQPDFAAVLNDITADQITNIIHSEYDCEAPIINDRITGYVAIRPSIKEKLIMNYGISETRVRVLYNGIDFKRFNPDARKVNTEEYIKVVIPCTIDILRMKFLRYYADKACPGYRVYIYGKDYGNDFKYNQYVYVYDQIFNIEDAMTDADYVAGILLGRVNLEARAMGIPSIVHDPENPEKKEIFFPEYNEFKKRHDVVNLAKEIIL